MSVRQQFTSQYLSSLTGHCIGELGESLPPTGSTMALVLRPHEASVKHDFSTSFFHSMIHLRDWWLIEAEEEFAGKKLAVAGFPYRKEESVKPVRRVFKSAPITKAYDFYTIETADGVCIDLDGLLNKSHTIENGFSEEAFEHFLYGFPMNWETINYESIRKHSKAAAAAEAGVDSTVLTSSRDKDSSPDETRPTNDNVVEALNEHGCIQTGNSAEGAQKGTSNMGSDLSKAGPEAAQMGPEGFSSPHLVTEGKSSWGRRTRSRTAVESGEEIESTVNVSLSARTTRSKTAVGFGTMGESNAMGRNLSGKTSKKVTNDLGTRGEREDIKMEVASRRNSQSKTTATTIKGLGESCTKRKEDGRKEQLPRKRTEDGQQTDQRRDTSKQARTRANADLQATLFSSPETFKRSRSGRTLLPRLEFWKNQQPIYNADRSLAGIQEGLNTFVESPPNGGIDSSRRKKGGWS